MSTVFRLLALSLLLLPSNSSAANVSIDWRIANAAAALATNQLNADPSDAKRIAPAIYLSSECEIR